MLLAEKNRLRGEMTRCEQEIARIDRIIKQEGLAVPPVGSEPVPGGEVSVVTGGLSTAAIGPESGGARGTPELVNVETKVQTLMRVLKAATIPLTPTELVKEMTRLGYKFLSRNPTNTLNPYLYGRRKLDTVDKVGRGFVLTSRRKEFENMLPAAQAASSPAPPEGSPPPLTLER